MNEHKLWDSVKHPIGLADMVHVGWVQRLLRSAEWMGFPGPEPDLVVDGQTRVEAHARRVFDKFVELGIEYVAEPTDSEPGAQRIRPVNEVLAFRKATCIDLCVAFCCAALDAGIYPLILTVTADRGLNRHAIVLVPLDRVWANNCGALLETGFSRELLEVDGEALGTMVYESEGDPSGTWLAIDVQQVTEVGANWGAALSSGAQYIRDWEWDVCVDVGGLRSRTSDRELPPGGHIEKVLAPAYAALPEDFTPLQLIKARHGVVPYQQCAEMRQLREWAMTVPSDSRTGGNGRNADISVAVVTGAGGSGKTRMAAQLCHDLSTIGWYTGFLPSTTEVTDEELAALAKVATELLVVVDYAEEARRGLVARVVRKLRARESATRIVLTARGADTWWEEFYEEAEQDGTVLSNTLPLPIRGKQDVEADPWFFGRMYRRAVRQFSDMLNGAVPPDVEVPEGLGDTALDVVLRAWLAVCGNDEVAKKDMPTREELYDKVLSIEFTRWRKELKLGDISRDQLRRAAAALSLLAPSQDEDAVDDVLSRLPEWSQEHLLRSRFAELLVQSLLRDSGAESVSLRPDPVAEHLILAVFGKKPELLDRVLPQDPAKVPGIDAPDADDSIVTRKLEWGQQARNACVTLTRASSLDREAALCLARRALRERPFLWKEALDVALTQGGPFAQALTALIESGADLPLGKIDNEIPVGHPALAGAALAATRRLATSAERSPEQQAHWANNLSIRLSDVGERKVALEAAREAVELHRGLTEASPQAFTADLAGALSNLANRLSDVGERDEALGVAREAVGLFWGLAEASPQVFGPDMAGALSNLAVFLSGVGERDEALGVAREAVGLYRGLTEASPQAYRHELARSLSNLPALLSGVGERDEAVGVAREAVGLYRGLAEASPQAFRHELARSINNLANRLSDVGKRDKAVEIASEAVGLYRGLAQASPQAFSHYLAGALSNLAALLSDVGKRDKAVEIASEAVGLYRGLAQASPQAFSHYLAGALSNLANHLSGVGERDEAVRGAREAVGLYRGLAEASTQAFAPYLAQSLNNLAVFLSGVGERDEAVRVAREAVGLYRGLAEASPQAFTPDLAGALSNLATFLVESGHSEKAPNVFVEGLDHLSPAARAHLLCVRSTWRTDGRESEDLVGAAREANSTDDPGLLGPVRRMIARVITDAGISDTGLPRWVTVDAESATSRIEGWLECSDLARRVAFLEAQWSLPSASEKETLAALAELYVDRPSVAALAALVERIADEGIQAVTTDLRIQYRAQLLARDWYEAHLNGRGASFLREHMRVGVGAPREGGGDNAAMKTDPAEWDRDLSDPAMRSAVQDVLAEELPDVETTRMGLLLELADLSDPATAYEAYDSDEGAEDSLRHFLESHNWRAMLAVLGVRPGVADSAHGRIAALLAAAVGGESTERLRELYEYANEAMDAIDRRHLQALLDQALRTRQCPATFADILTWIKHPNSQTR